MTYSELLTGTAQDAARLRSLNIDAHVSPLGDEIDVWTVAEAEVIVDRREGAYRIAGMMGEEIVKGLSFPALVAWIEDN